MLIGFDASRANAKQRTGVEWYGYHVLRELANLDLENQYRVYSWEPLRDDLAALPKNFESVVVPPRRFWPYTALSRELRRNPVDALCIPSHLVPRVHPRNTVVTVHDLGFRHFPDNYTRYQRLSLKYGTRWSVKWAKHVVVPSQAVAADVQSFYGTGASHITIIPNGYDHEIFRGMTATEVHDVMQRHRVQDPYLMYIGRLEVRKNVSRIIEAFYRLRDSGLFGGQLVLVGNPGEGYDEIRELILKEREAGSIIQPGHLPSREYAALLRGARAFIFPSLFEGFGIPILEAFAAKTPVLTSRGGATEEVAGAAAHLVDPYSVEEIHLGMEKLLSDQAYAKQLVSAGAERVKDFSWRKTAAHILEELTS